MPEHIKNEVVVTGTGAITSIGHNSEAFWQSCLNGTTNVEDIPEHWHRIWTPKSKLICPLPLPDYRAFGFKKFELLQHDVATLNAIVATKEAIENANIALSASASQKNAWQLDLPVPAQRIGVYIGTGAGGNQSLLDNVTAALAIAQKSLLEDDVLQQTGLEFEDIKEAFYSGKYFFNTFSLPMSLHNCVASTLATKFTAKGAANVEVYACASGTIAIGKAYQAIQRGEIDLAICGGTEYTHDACGSTFHGFDILGALSTYDGDKQEASRPFDRDRANFVFSQGGTGILVLENKRLAFERNAPILAELSAFSTSFDCHHFMQPDPSGEAVIHMLEQLLLASNIDKNQVDYFNAHGTGTIINDEIECRVIAQALHNNVSINSTKSLLGHTLGASGALEAIVTALSIRDAKLHVSQNLKHPIADLNFVTQSVDQPLEHAISVSYAFGGQNAALLFSRAI